MLILSGMHTNFSFKNLFSTEKAFVEDYFSKDAKLGKIQAIVNRLNADETLEVRVEKFVKKSAYKVSLILQKPIPSFSSWASEASSPCLTAH